MYDILLATSKPQSRKQSDKEIIVHHNQQEDRFPENPFDVFL